jgi:hypothetical protein
MKSKKLIVVVTFTLILLIIGLFIFLITRNTFPKNPKERNKIIFKATPLEVQDSIIAILPYLNKLPVYNSDWTNYLISDSTELYLNFKNLGSIEKLFTEDTALDGLTKGEKNRFLHLALFLNDNYLFRCDFFKSTNNVEYIYRDFKDAGDFQADLIRFITLGNSLQSFDKNRYQILDASENLILYANKDAKIWEGEKK